VNPRAKAKCSFDATIKTIYDLNWSAFGINNAVPVRLFFVDIGIKESG
jgi:hypothetical protein